MRRNDVSYEQKSPAHRKDWEVPSDAEDVGSERFLARDEVVGRKLEIDGGDDMPQPM